MRLLISGICRMCFFLYLCGLKTGNMRHMRKYSALILLALFSCYYCGISMFAHSHNVHGASLIHSHLGGGTDHSHSDSEYAVIDILSHFQSEAAVEYHCLETPFFFLIDSDAEYIAPAYLSGAHSVYSLRGPPQA